MGFFSLFTTQVGESKSQNPVPLFSFLRPIQLMLIFFFSFSKFCKVIIFDATLILIPGLWAPRPTNPVTLLGSTHFYLPLRPPAKVSSRSNLCSNFYPRFSSEPLSHAFKVVLEIDFLVGLEDSSAVPLNGPFCAGFLGAWPTRAHLALTGHHAKKHPFFPISWALAQIPIKVFYSNFLIYHHRAQQKTSIYCGY